MSDEALREIISTEPAQEAVLEQAPEQVQEQPVVNEFEVKAVEKGWKPKEQYSGDPDDWKPAKQWLEFGELLDTVHSLKRKSSDFEEKINTVVELSAKAQAAQKEQVIKELKSRQREAVEIGDFDSVDSITEELTQVKASIPQQPASQAKPSMDESVKRMVEDFSARNAHWFNQSAENISAYREATIYEDYLSRERPELTIPERFAKVEAHIKQEFPQKFQNARQSAPPAVESSSNNLIAPKDKKITLRDLPKNLQRIGSTLKPENVEQYIKDCQAAGLI